MTKKIAYLDRKGAIRAELVRLAKARQTITYGELGKLVGVPARGPWKPILDEISRDEAGRGLPDITFLVINAASGLPGQIGFQPAKPPTAEQRRLADQVIQQVFQYYGR